MKIKAVIFDMDGLLIDSEPFWQESGKETLEQFNAELTDEQYHSSTGLRTKEWVDLWFTHFGIDPIYSGQAESTIVSKALEKIGANGKGMSGVDYLFNFFTNKEMKIGLASSSPVALIEVVATKLNIRQHLNAIASAEDLTYGKPHPQVFLDCAKQMSVSPLECLVFEDSLNGVIAAKAARMKCIAVPDPVFRKDARWSVADVVLNSLDEFDEEKFNDIQKLF
ncbi:MAG TPA: hexitol phosphatase HxpB [Flavitalea sp.]|nr:hexitol phosphatase HxpB [Flavitalea sp.]